MATGFSIASSSTENNLSSSSSASLSYKLKITLLDDQCTDEEGRWRRVIVPANFSLYGLHILIQEIFGWKSYYMHNFMSMGEGCSLSEDEESSLIEQPSKKPKNDRPEHDPVEHKVTDGYWEIEKLPEVGKYNGLFVRYSHVHQKGCFTSPHQVRGELVYKLYDVFNEENRYLEYEYDFGASWNHVIEFEGEEKDASKNGEFPSCVDGRGANRMEDCQDETSDGELKPSFKRRKFNLKQCQRNLRKIFAGKWPFSNVDSAKTPKYYACYWLNVKKGGCRGTSCDGKCCGVFLKSDYIRQLAALPNEEANRLYEVTEKQLNKIRREFLENGLCNYKESNGDACIECNK